MISLAFVFILSSCNSQNNANSDKKVVSVEQKKRPTKHKLKKNDNDKESIDNIESYIVELEEDDIDETGYVNKEDAKVLVDVFYEEASKAQKNKVFKKVEKGVFSVYLELESGVRFVYLPKIKGVKAGGEDSPKIYSFNLEDEDSKALDKSIGSFKENIEKSTGNVTEWEKYEQPFFNENGLKSLNDNNPKIIFIDSHGGYTDSLGSFLVTNIEYDEDLHGTDVVINQDNNLVLNADSFDSILSKNSLKNSLVILNACNSSLDMVNPMTNKQLTQVLLDKGATSVVGYNRLVETKYTDYINDKLLEYLSKHDKDKGYMTLEEALTKAVNSHEDDEIDKSIVDIYGKKDYSLGKYVDYKVMYDDILKNIDKQDYGSDLDPTGEYMYSFANLNEDKVPELLIAASDSTGLSHVKIFSFNEKTGKLIEFEDVFATGVAKAGGYRGLLYASNKNKGMIHISFTSVSSDAEAYRYTIDGNKFNMESISKFKMPNTPKDLKEEIIDIEWMSAKDGSSLHQDIPDDYKKEDKKTAEDDADTDKKAEAESGDLANDGLDKKDSADESKDKQTKNAQENNGQIGNDPIVLDGKIKLLSNDQLLKMMKKEDLNKKYGGSKLNPILLLDEPKSFNFKMETGEESEEKQTDMIIVGNLGQMKDYDGKDVKIRINPDKTYWPADEKSPLNHPTTKDYEIIN